jgi:PAS domain S-box-containing protein
MQQELIAPAVPQPDDRLNRFLWRLIEASPVAVAAVDQTGAILYANQKLADLFRYEVSELMGNPIEILIPERYRGDHLIYRTLFAENPHTRPMGSGLDLAGRRRDGSEFPIEVGLSYFRADGNLIVLGSITDITRRKQTEELLERRVEERTVEIERRRRVADSLRDILRVLNSNRSLQEILDIIVAQARELLRADASAIYQLHEGNNPLRFQAGVGIAPDQLTAIYSEEGQKPTEPTHDQQPHNHQNRNHHGALLGDSNSSTPIFQVDGRDYCAQLAVPLKLKDEIYGGLMLYYREPRRFSSEEIELAVMFGDQAALAIENAHLRVQAEQIAVAAERNRIARDMHDSVTQTLFSASLIAEVLPRLVQRHPDESMRRLEELRQLTRGALAEMRTLLLELRPATLMEVSIEELLRQLTEAARGRARIPIEVQIMGCGELPPAVKVAYYYVAQEALNNVTKHARATQVQVSLRCDNDRSMLEIEDDGQGFDATRVTPEHLGLAIMHERADSIGATLTIRSAHGAGTTITLTWRQADTKS